MVGSSVVDSRKGLDESGLPSAEAMAAPATTWAFVYIFFTNGIPFDSPNRSEPCPRS